MDSRFGREVVVGSIVLAAALVFGAGVLWLNGKSINPGDDKIIVQLPDAGQLKPASQVRVSGVPAGKVEEITLIEPGKVHVTISLTNKAVVPKIDAKAAIMSVGLAGDVVLLLFPGYFADGAAQGPGHHGLHAAGADGNRRQPLRPRRQRAHQRPGPDRAGDAGAAGEDAGGGDEGAAGVAAADDFPE